MPLNSRSLNFDISGLFLKSVLLSSASPGLLYLQTVRTCKVNCLLIPPGTGILAAILGTALLLVVKSWYDYSRSLGDISLVL